MPKKPIKRYRKRLVLGAGYPFFSNKFIGPDGINLGFGSIGLYRRKYSCVQANLQKNLQGRKGIKFSKKFRLVLEEV